MSLFGHPVAGNRWDKQAEEIVISEGFKKIPDWKAMFVHPVTKAAIGVYVDDFELAADKKETDRIWKRLEKKIKFGEDYHTWGTKLTRHLG